ncbi:hypothetical protein RRG08_036923 [Elysia crispata]|uniref:Paraneoplastic antigen Ma-like C-terminal domain-containing protein n=1 Tax=Elysia crispata TaxID=231223 RepID=A0AAE0ZID9_9GAST|nr:hypothetical protein RRG08_036923 [Elysia crispata]
MCQHVQEWERKRLGNPWRQNRMNQLSYALDTSVGGSYPPEDNARIVYRIRRGRDPVSSDIESVSGKNKEDSMTADLFRYVIWFLGYARQCAGTNFQSGELVSDIGDIGDQNYLPGGGEIDTRVHTILPRLPLFSGETKDAAFDLWKYEVECLRTEVQSVFGPTETAQNNLSRFYSLQQGQTEDAGAFAARLEDAILQAVQLGSVRKEDVDAMICEAFEGGLRRETKSVTSYLFTPRKEFSKLLVEVKRKRGSWLTKLELWPRYKLQRWMH